MLGSLAKSRAGRSERPRTREMTVKDGFGNKLIFFWQLR
jgi:hypothetical protein